MLVRQENSKKLAENFEVSCNSGKKWVETKRNVIKVKVNVNLRTLQTKNKLKDMQMRMYILITFLYNILFLAIAYKGLENHFSLEYLKREIESQARIDTVLKMDTATNAVNYEIIGKIILGCIVIGLVCYGINTANSTFHESIFVKGYVVGNRYLVSILDYYTGADVTISTPSDGVPLEVPTVITLVESPVSQETIPRNYTPHVLTPDESLESTIIEEMSTVGNYLTQLGLW